MVRQRRFWVECLAPGVAWVSGLCIFPRFHSIPSSDSQILKSKKNLKRDLASRRVQVPKNEMHFN